jgi:hypothetical protein
MDWYPVVVLLHILGAFGFALSHGASVLAAFRLRAERDPVRIGALLDLSAFGLGAMYASLLLLVAAGVTAGFIGGWWGRAWIWTAIGVLVVVMGAMYPLGSQYFRDLRHAVGQRAYGDKEDPVPATPAQLEVLLTSNRPVLVAAVGLLGLATLVWLMVVKPF